MVVRSEFLNFFEKNVAVGFRLQSIRSTVTDGECRQDTTHARELFHAVCAI